MNYTSEHVKNNEKLSILNGAASIVANSLVSGFIPLFAIGVLGATNQQVGLISSLPSLMSMLAMIPAAIWINRLETKKAFTSLSILSARFFLLLMVFIPFITIVNQAWILVVLIALMNLPNAIATLSWQSFIGDIIPDKRRGAFFSERSRILTFVGMIVTITAGVVISRFDKTDTFPYQVLFVAGFLFGLIEVYYLMKHFEIKRERVVSTEKRAFTATLMNMISHRPYRSFVLCAVLFNFGWQMAWPLFTIYQINDAHATALWISLFTVVNSISQMLSYKWWGRSADKWGNSVMLFIAGIGMATAPILTIMSTNLIYLTLVNLYSGIFVAGTVMLLFNQLLHVSPEKERTSFLATYNIILGAVGFIAPQIGVLLLELYNINLAMTISSGFRLLGGIAFLLVVVYIEKKSNKGPYKELTLNG
jgi:MFS family permease